MNKYMRKYVPSRMFRVRVRTKKTDGLAPPEDELTTTDKRTTPAKDLAALRDKIKVKLRKFKRI